MKNSSVEEVGKGTLEEVRKGAVQNEASRMNVCMILEFLYDPVKADAVLKTSCILSLDCVWKKHHHSENSNLLEA